MTRLEFPVGEVARFDIAWDNADRLPDTEQTTYLFVGETTVHTLNCGDTSRPPDAWASIAETFEFLAAETAQTEALDGVEPHGPIVVGGRLESPAFGIALDAPDDWYGIDLSHPGVETALQTFDETTPDLYQAYRTVVTVSPNEIADDLGDDIAQGTSDRTHGLVAWLRPHPDDPASADRCELVIQPATVALEALIPPAAEPGHELFPGITFDSAAIIDLPLGRTVRLDSTRDVDGAPRAGSQFIVIDGDRDIELFCSGSADNRARWLEIAESLESYSE